jgi:hypothetical protein
MTEMGTAEWGDGSSARPGELMRLVSAGLTAGGFDVRLPVHEEERRLLVGSPDAECSLTVSDWGDVELEFTPRRGEDVEPAQLADMASLLPTGRHGDKGRPGGGHRHAGLTLKGIAGLELRGRGINVELDVWFAPVNLEALRLGRDA